MNQVSKMFLFANNSGGYENRLHWLRRCIFVPKKKDVFLNETCPDTIA